MMNDLQSRVMQPRPEEAHWEFRSGFPKIYTRSPGCGYPRSVEVDPCPAYAHELGLVVRTAQAVEAAFPVRYPPTYYLLPFEATSRTNGHAARDTVYQEDDRWSAHIVLSAKRIPIHPGMTRYLVAHEYGHVVQYHLEAERGINSNQDPTDLEREYAELRGVEILPHYGAGTWHATVGELFANDFRILVCGVEPEFWPHPGFSRPEAVPAVQKFWREAVERYALSAEEVHPQ